MPGLQRSTPGLTIGAMFWKEKTLAKMSSEEWESLCDGCALCCMHKVEDEDTGELYYTNLACRLLDTRTCRCIDYPNRVKEVVDCIDLAKGKGEAFDWLPASCAYRRLARGQDLPEWHPLITGNPDSVHEAGISMRGVMVSERDTEEWTVLQKLTEDTEAEEA